MKYVNQHPLLKMSNYRMTSRFVSWGADYSQQPNEDQKGQLGRCCPRAGLFLFYLIIIKLFRSESEKTDTPLIYSTGAGFYLGYAFPRKRGGIQMNRITSDTIRSKKDGGGHSELIQNTVRLGERLFGKKVSPEEAREMVENVAVYFSLLFKWNSAQNGLSSSPANNK